MSTETRWKETFERTLAGVKLGASAAHAMPAATLEDKVARANVLIRAMRVVRYTGWTPIFPFAASSSIRGKDTTP